MSFPARFPGKCAKCGEQIPAGVTVNYDAETKTIRHAPNCKAGVASAASVQPSTAPVAEKKSETVTDETEIWGRVTYKGKQGYLLLWSGETKSGKDMVKLAFRDGSKIFWADRAEVTIEKRYETEERRTNRIVCSMSFGKLNRLAAEYKSNGGKSNAPTKQCWECGGTFTYADAKERDGDWSESYCGC